MDIASLIGLIIGTGCLGVVLFEASHGHMAMYYSLEGVLMVGGGTVSVIFMAMPMEKIKLLVGFFKRFLFHKSRDPVGVITLFASLADKARRDGLLALEGDIKKIRESDPFLASGLRMAVDGINAGDVEMTLRMEILAMQERHKVGKKFFDLIKLYGPGWALVGTLIGQIAMFGNLSGGDAGALGKSLAIAVCATMYGTVVANAVAGPIGDKLAMRSSEEILVREMMLQGIISLQTGDNPRITTDKMLSFVPPVARSEVRDAA